MREFHISKRITITDESKPFVIAEIGHNHMGFVRHCKYLFKLAKECGCDAVKLQKRNNRTLLTDEFYNSPYISENSYGQTYGEHREYLEFNLEQYLELQLYAEHLDLVFFATVFDKDSVDFVDQINMPIIKIQSGDIVNFELIEHVANKRRPVILSTGCSDYSDIYKAVAKLESCGITNFALLHCISTYPNRADEINLSIIPRLKQAYKSIIIGFSSHYNGVLASVAAYCYGAQIIEQHFTDSHVNKGTDHPLSLEPKGMKELVHYLYEVYKMKGDGIKCRLKDEIEGRGMKVLRKSVYVKSKKKGERIKKEDISFRVPFDPNGITLERSDFLIDKIVPCDMSSSTAIGNEFYWNLEQEQIIQKSIKKGN